MTTWNEINKLVELARAGDRAAFGQLVERFQPAVYAVALARLRNVNEALELTQDVFVHALRKLEQLRDPQCFVGWLRQIATRMAINRLNRRTPWHGTDPEVLQNEPDEAVTPLDDLVRAEQRAEVWKGLDRLKPTDRATLVAFYMRGQTIEQMSNAFQTPIGTIKRRLHVARKRLRQQLERKANRRNAQRRRQLAEV